MELNEASADCLAASELRAACRQILENYKRAGLSRISFDRRLLGVIKRQSKSTIASEPSRNLDHALTTAPRTSPPDALRTSPPDALRNIPPEVLRTALPEAESKPSAFSSDSSSPTFVSEGHFPSGGHGAPKSSSGQTIEIGFTGSENLSGDKRAIVFQELNMRVCQCMLCPELVRNRTKTVFGVGNLEPKIVFFGEAPGADEDKSGEPFVGKAGQLLTKIIEASHLTRQEVYIMNALKCRPPNNRTPTDLEIENCRPFHERQLAVLKPEFIVCLGSVAVRAVLKSKQSIGSLRGRFHSAFGARVLVTYHPSYLLRTESAKKYTWEDMKMLMRELGTKLQ